MVRNGLASLALAGAAMLGQFTVVGAQDATFEDFFARLSVAPPTESNMTVCFGFDCRGRLTLEFTEADHKAITKLFDGAKASPKAERDAVANVVAWFDRRVGPLAGTTGRVPRAAMLTPDKAHNFDCVDTSTNTTSLLLVLAEWGLLRHHSVGRSAYRGNLLFGQTPHNTATLVERGSGKEWSVDMWTTRYGERAEVMPMEQWLQAK